VSGPIESCHPPEVSGSKVLGDVPVLSKDVQLVDKVHLLVGQSRDNSGWGLEVECESTLA